MNTLREEIFAEESFEVLRINRVKDLALYITKVQVDSLASQKWAT